MFPPNYYNERATELEALARGISDLTTREMCLDLARRFRDIANVKSVTQQSDIEIVHLAERMVGKAPSPDKHQAASVGGLSLPQTQGGLTVACESGDTQFDRRSLQVNLVRCGRTIPVPCCAARRNSRPSSSAQCAAA